MTSHKFRKYYIKGSTLPFEEDSNKEFKGHMNLCKEEIPVWATEKNGDKPSRKPSSRNLNAFLNSGSGGTLYLGVMDSGKICGFNMSRLQRDHFMRSLDDLMSRYTPKVLPHQYSVRFTPVFDSCITPEEIVQQLERIQREEVDERYIDRKHVLQTNNYCWCDKDSVASLNVTNRAGQEFVVEVMIKPWDPYNSCNPSAGKDEDVKIQPYYTDEEGKMYFRRQASVVQYSLNSIVQITKQEVKDRYDEEIKRLKAQYEEMLKKAGKQEMVCSP